MFLALVCEYTYVVFCLLAMRYLWQQEIVKQSWKYLFVLIVIILVSIIEQRLNMEEILIYPVEVVSILFLVEGNKVQNFLRFFMTDIMIGLFQRVGAYIFIATGISTYAYTLDRGVEKLILRVCTLLSIILLGKKFMKYSNYLKKLTWYHMGLCIGIEICLVFIMAQAEMGMFFNGSRIVNNITMGMLLLVCILILAVIIIFIIVDINRKHYQEQNKLKDDYLKIQEKYYQTVALKDEEVRRVRHDMKAHLGCIEILLEQSNYQEAEKYIKELKNDTVKRIDTSFESGNDVINAVLNDVSDAANKHGTQIILLGILPSNLKIQSPELCSLFYNLLSNSEEAMKHYRGKLPREIYVEISSYKRSVGITVRNPVEQTIEIDKLGKYTTKNDEGLHGYGIRNVKSIVEKYKGLLEYKNKDGYLVCQITFMNFINF